jgi:CRISPR system Cascade subunit CasD
MATLLLVLDAPMQSWGTRSNFGHRDTEREPSKSAVIGLLCAALGRARHEPLEDLAGLRMGLRVDMAGVVLRDFQTAGNDGYYKVSGAVERNNVIISDRYYLSDAKFLVGLEGEYDFLAMLQGALQHPVWFLALGRKAFIPSRRVWLPDGLQEGALEDVLMSYAWLGRGKTRPSRLRMVVERADGTSVRNDQPLSFKPRRFLPRYVVEGMVDTPTREEG